MSKLKCPNPRFLHAPILPTIRKVKSVLKRKSPRLKADNRNLLIQKVQIPETGQGGTTIKRPNPPKKHRVKVRNGASMLKLKYWIMTPRK